MWNQQNYTVSEQVIKYCLCDKGRWFVEKLGHDKCMLIQTFGNQKLHYLYFLTTFSLIVYVLSTGKKYNIIIYRVI